MLKEYLEIKKRIRDDQLAEKTGEIELQTDLSKFFKPITETQKVTTKEITEGLKPISEGLAPIREGIVQIPVQLSEIIKTFPRSSHIKVEVKVNEEEIRNFTKVFNEKLAGHKNDFDRVYRIVYDSDLEEFRFGKHVISYNPVNKTFSYEGNEIQATDGLWELILSKDPEKYTQKDFNSYQYMIYLSDIMFKDNNRKNYLKNYNVLGDKWQKIIKPVFDHVFKKEISGKGIRKKKTTTVIPSDPNALLERLDLLMASKEAGNTGVRNELISICDELKRQHVLNTKSYKKLISLL